MFVTNFIVVTIGVLLCLFSFFFCSVFVSFCRLLFSVVYLVLRYVGFIFVLLLPSVGYVCVLL